MASRISLFRRRSDLSAAAFSHHWQVIHAPIALGLPGLEHYEQNTVREREDFGTTSLSERITDGICKLRFADAVGVQGVFDPETVQILRADEAQFLDDLCTLSLDSITLGTAEQDGGHKAFLLLDMRGATAPGTLEEALATAARATRIGHVRHRVTARTIARAPVGREDLPIDLVEEFQPAGSTLPAVFVAALRAQIAAAGAAGTLLIATSHTPTAQGSRK